MTKLNLVRVPIATNKLAKWAGDRGWVSGHRGVVAFDEGRALHHLIDEAFGPGTLRPFRILVPPRRASGNLYAYSESHAGALRTAAAAHALPEHLSVLDIDRLQSKPMPSAWHFGQRIGFDVRFRPVRRLGYDLDTSSGRVAKGSEMDAFLLEALHRYPTNLGGMAQENRTRAGVYFDWLAERLGSTAQLDHASCRLTHFRRLRAARGRKNPEGPDAIVHGTLIVTDPATFPALLARGVGRHRAYGYGMLLLRPPSRSAPRR